MTQQALPLAEPTAAEVLVRDPLSAVTRKERLYLLAVSLIGIAMVRTGLVPSKIATFGIVLDKPNRSALLFLLALVTAYFLVAFVLYAASDWTARYEALRVANERLRMIGNYQRVAYMLFTSEENIRRLYEQGELEAYAFEKLRNINPEVHGIDIDPDTKQRLEQTLDIHYERFMEMDDIDQAKELVKLMETSFGAGFSIRHPRRIKLVATSRVIFEFVLPLGVGGYAIYTLLARSLLG